LLFIYLLGNKQYCSYAVNTGEMTFVFSAPYSLHIEKEGSTEPNPNFNHAEMVKFVADHGLAVRAVTIKVRDATKAYEISTANGALGVMPPKTMTCRYTNKTSVISEIRLFGDTVIRWMSGDYDGPVLPNYEAIPVKNSNSIGIQRVDHIVSNVPKLFDAVDYLIDALGLHEFGEFTAEDVGTVDSGLNSMVLANNNEFVLLPINEPTFGTPRKSQIQTYLEHNSGAGVQHIAVKTNDIFATMREMRKRSEFGGFDFMPTPKHEYYERTPERCGENAVTPEQLKQCEELGLLIDKDDQGVLLQIFTCPVSDRTTLFMEIIQRLGCDHDEKGNVVEQAAGCGGFGKVSFLQFLL
jgi:4-hydroxyphenylpyruvate dioxygenase